MLWSVPFESPVKKLVFSSSPEPSPGGKSCPFIHMVALRGADAREARLRLRLRAAAPSAGAAMPVATCGCRWRAAGQLFRHEPPPASLCISSVTAGVRRSIAATCALSCARYGADTSSALAIHGPTASTACVPRRAPPPLITN